MTNLESYLTQGTEAWLAYRKTKITATDSAKILGVSPYGSCYGLWLEKTGRKPPQKSNPAMEYGTRMEDEIRVWAENKLGEWFPPEVVESKKDSFMMASLDGISADRKTILEIKTCGTKVFEDAKQGKIPDHYRSQGMHQIACVPEAEKVHFVFFHKGEYAEVDLYPDWEFISKMIEEEKFFYEHHMITDLPPEMSEKDYLNMDDSPEWSVLAFTVKLFNKEYEIEKARFKKFKTEWDRLKKDFIELSDDGNCEGSGIRLSKSWRTGALDVEKMKADGIDINKYVKSSFCTTKLTVLNE